MAFSRAANGEELRQLNKEIAELEVQIAAVSQRCDRALNKLTSAKAAAAPLQVLYNQLTVNRHPSIMPEKLPGRHFEVLKVLLDRHQAAIPGLREEWEQLRKAQLLLWARDSDLKAKLMKLQPLRGMPAEVALAIEAALVPPHVVIQVAPAETQPASFQTTLDMLAALQEDSYKSRSTAWSCCGCSGRGDMRNVCLPRCWICFVAVFILFLVVGAPIMMVVRGNDGGGSKNEDGTAAASMLVMAAAMGR